MTTRAERRRQKPTKTVKIYSINPEKHPYGAAWAAGNGAPIGDCHFAQFSDAEDAALNWVKEAIGQAVGDIEITIKATEFAG